MHFNRVNSLLGKLQVVRQEVEELKYSFESVTEVEAGLQEVLEKLQKVKDTILDMRYEK